MRNRDRPLHPDHSSRPRLESRLQHWRFLPSLPRPLGHPPPQPGPVGSSDPWVTYLRLASPRDGASRQWDMRSTYVMKYIYGQNRQYKSIKTGSTRQYRTEIWGSTNWIESATHTHNQIEWNTSRAGVNLWKVEPKPTILQKKRKEVHECYSGQYKAVPNSNIKEVIKYSSVKKAVHEY